MRWFVACIFSLACLSAWPISEAERTELQGISLDFEIASSVLSPASKKLMLALLESTNATLVLSGELAITRQLLNESQADLSEARLQLTSSREELSSSRTLNSDLVDSFKDYRQTSESLRRRTAFTWAVGGVVIGAGVTLAIVGLVKLFS